MSRKTFKILLVLSAVAAVLLSVFLVTTIISGRSAESKAVNFIGYLESGQAEKSYEEASPELREQVDIEEWTTYVGNMETLIDNPVLVDQVESTNGNKKFAFENPVGFRFYSFVVELENNNDGWRVRHFGSTPTKFDPNRFRPQVEEVQ